MSHPRPLSAHTHAIHAGDIACTTPRAQQPKCQLLAASLPLGGESLTPPLQAPDSGLLKEALLALTPLDTEFHRRTLSGEVVEAMEVRGAGCTRWQAGFLLWA